jgi:hypothetical protein
LHEAIAEQGRVLCYVESERLGTGPVIAASPHKRR